MPALLPPLADRIKAGIQRISTKSGGPDAEAIRPLQRSLERTLARINPGTSSLPALFRFQVTGGKSLLFLGTDALPLEPAPLVRLLNNLDISLQAGETLEVDGDLAAWLLRPEVTLTDNNLRNADATLKQLKMIPARDRDHSAAQAAESAKIRLRGRLTQLVTALQAAQTDGQGKFTGPPLPPVLDQTPAPTPPPAPPPAPVVVPPPAVPVVVQPQEPPMPPPEPEPVPGFPPELLNKALRKIVAAVEGIGFKYAAVGDVGGAAAGSKRPIHRIELLVGFEGPQRENLLSAARGEGLQPSPDEHPLHLQFTDPKLGACPVDILQATTPFMRQMLSRAQMAEVLRVGLKCATSEDLILSRAAETDRAADLLRAAASRLDAAYVKKEAEAAGVLPQLKAAWQLAKSQG